MEIVIFQMFELGPRCREQLFDHLDMRVHRAAYVQKQQHFDRVVTFGPGFDVQIAMFGGGADGAVQIQFIRRTLARPAAQAFQGDLDVARAQFNSVV